MFIFPDPFFKIGREMRECLAELEDRLVQFLDLGNLLQAFLGPGFVARSYECDITSSPTVPDPEAVRYAWNSYPEANLYNKENLPAFPFRTDDWPDPAAKPTPTQVPASAPTPKSITR